MKKVALLGHGTVGAGVAQLLLKDAKYIEKQSGEAVSLKYILDIREFKDVSYKELFTLNFSDILNDPEISVVCEAMGGTNPAYQYTKELLSSGKSVVTSNKELVAEHGAELLRIAKENDCNYFFEASVGGGIPIIRTLYQSLGSSRIEWIQGILNGTTNFIMTQMIENKLSFDEALSLAQQKGYAEKDPNDDINGDDACRKLCILASLTYGTHIYPKEVYKQGISNLTLSDVAYADDWGGVIKLVGEVRQLPDGKLSMTVTPAFVSEKSLLSGVNGVFNAVLVKGEAVDELLFVGRGAGMFPTANAVVSDVVEAVRREHTDITQHWVERSSSAVADYRKEKRRFYIRAEGMGGLKSYIGLKFSNPKFLRRAGAPANEVAFVTDLVSEENVESWCNSLRDKGFNLLSRIPILRGTEDKADD